MISTRQSTALDSKRESVNAMETSPVHGYWQASERRGMQLQHEPSAVVFNYSWIMIKPLDVCPSSFPTLMPILLNAIPRSPGPCNKENSHHNAT